MKTQLLIYFYLIQCSILCVYIVKHWKPLMTISNIEQNLRKHSVDFQLSIVNNHSEKPWWSLVVASTTSFITQFCLHLKVNGRYTFGLRLIWKWMVTTHLACVEMEGGKPVQIVLASNLEVDGHYTFGLRRIWKWMVISPFACVKIESGKHV